MTVTTRPTRCGSCQREVPLGTDIDRLAFYESRGPGTQDDTCATCRYHRVAHTPTTRNRHICREFTPMVDGYPYDLYYCGCFGFD